jgi:hypothetical protein
MTAPQWYLAPRSRPRWEVIRLSCFDEVLRAKLAQRQAGFTTAPRSWVNRRLGQRYRNAEFIFSSIADPGQRSFSPSLFKGAA